MVRITINYETRLKRKFEKAIRFFGNELKRELQNISINRYYKIENQFQASFKIELKEKRNELIVNEVLKIANTLWHSGCLNWTFNGPHLINDQLIFECFLNNHDDDQPIKWAHVEYCQPND